LLAARFKNNSQVLFLTHNFNGLSSVRVLGTHSSVQSRLVQRCRLRTRSVPRLCTVYTRMLCVCIYMYAYVVYTFTYIRVYWRRESCVRELTDRKWLRRVRGRFSFNVYGQLGPPGQPATMQYAYTRIPINAGDGGSTLYYVYVLYNNTYNVHWVRTVRVIGAETHVTCRLPRVTQAYGPFSTWLKLWIQITYFNF